MYRKIENSDAVIRLEDGASIPADPQNRDFAAYLDWTAAGGVAEAPAPLRKPVPDAITDRQFFQGLAARGLVTQTEALDAVRTGALPARLEGFVKSLPVEEQFPARMILSGATTYHRSSPLTAAFGALAGMTPSEIDEFWTYCASL